MENRINNLKNEFKSFFGYDSTDVFESPGRIELLGNHTDHNHGKVLVSSVDLSIVAVCKKTNDDKVVFFSKGYKPMEIKLDDLEKNEKEFGTSVALIKGVLFKMQELGYKIGGFVAYADSNVPKGAGVSSSASFEVLISKIVSYYYNSDSIKPFELAKISQFSEVNYFNKPCGLLDQSGIALGGINYIDFENTNEPVINSIKVNIPSYQFIIINTGEDHTELTSYYSAIKDDMKKVANYFGHDFLRECNGKEVLSKKEEIINKFGEDAYLRAYHFFKENDRVDEGYKALQDGNYNRFLELLTESGYSSYHYLKNCYCKSEDERLASSLRFVASVDKEAFYRVHGGGFAGTLLMVVKKENLEKDLKVLEPFFKKENIMLVSLNPNGTYHI